MITADELYYYTGVDLFGSDDELTHYGILGMKWGRRKGGSASQSKSKHKRTKRPVDLDDARDIRRNWKHLTPEQKKRAIQTLNIEDQYGAHINKRMQNWNTAIKLGGTALGAMGAGLSLYRAYDATEKVFNDRHKKKKPRGDQT